MFAALALLCAAPPADAERLPLPRLVRFDGDGYRLPDGAVLRLGSTARRHADATAIYWSADGKTIVTTDWRTAKVWDAADGKLVARREIADPRAGHTTLLSADGRRFARRTDAAVEVGDVATGEILARLPDAGEDDAVLALSVDGATVAAVLREADGGTKRTRLAVVRVADGRPVPLDPTDDPGEVGRLFFAPDGRRLYVRRDRLRAFDLATGKPLWSAPWHVMAASADGRWLVGTNNDRPTLRDVETGLRLDVPLGDGPVEGAAVSPDGGRVALSTERGCVVRDGKTGAVVAELRGAGRVLAFSPDGKRVATVDRVVDLWDATTGKPAWPDPPATGHTKALQSAAWSRDGATVVTASDVSGRAIAWDARTGAERWRAPAYAARLDGAAVVGDEVWVVTRSDRDSTGTSSLLAWDAATGAAKRTTKLDVPGTDTLWRRVFFGPTGVTLVDPEFKRCRVTVVAAATGRRTGGWTREYDRFAPWLTAAASDDGRYLACGDGRVVRTADGRPTAPLEMADADDHAFELAWNGDGTLLAGFFRGEDKRPAEPRGRLVVWERASGRAAFAADLPTGRADAPRWSPDGRTVYVKEGLVWGVFIDLTTGAVRSGTPAWAGRFHDARDAWSSARGLLAREADEGTVLLWDGRRPPLRTPIDAEPAWADLASDDAGKAWRAVWRLADAGAADALKQAKPVAADAKRAAELIAQLDAKAFRDREAASKGLADLGESAAGALRAALAAGPSAEVKDRIATLLEPLDPAKPPAGEALRSLRAIAALERIASPEAVKVLKDLAAGVAGARVTDAAQDALDRLGVR